jgi:hypothetical protein
MNSSRIFGFILGLMVLTAIFPASVHAAACLSNGNGLWSDAATWTNCNVTPQAGDTAQIQNGHAVTLDVNIPNVPITVASGGILEMSSLIDLGGSAVTVDGIFRLNSGAIVQNGTFTYNSDSGLHYNTGGSYNRGLEWSGGDPHHVQLSNNSTFNLAATTPQTIRGDLTIDDGATFLMGSSNADLIVQGSVNIQGVLELATGTGNIQVGGNWLKAVTPPTAPYKFKHNGRWVIFNGNRSQTITGAMNGIKDRFHYVVVTNNSDITHSGKIGVGLGLQVDAGSSFAPAANDHFEQELSSVGILSCAGTCVFNRLTMRRLDASGSTGIVDVNENFAILNQASAFTAPPAGALFTIAGNFHSDNTSGAIDFNGGTVEFDGSTMQMISGVGINSFHNLVVGSGTTLVDSANTAVTVSGTFTNNGVFRRAETLAAVGLQQFGLTNVTMVVNSLTGFPQITVDRIDSDHPGATTEIATYSDRHWLISDDAGGTFNVDLIFNDESLLNAAGQHTCRTADGGASWECLEDADAAATVTRRNGVVAFSEWQNCAACGPTAVALTALRLSPPHAAAWTFISLMGMLVLVTSYLLRRQRTTR